MTRRDEGVRVRHMLDHAREAVEMADGRDRADLDTDRQFSLAMVRLMEIVGEAAARVPDSFRQEHTQVPWAAEKSAVCWNSMPPCLAASVPPCPPFSLSASAPPGAAVKRSPPFLVP
jgi:hypothetical protein